MIRLPRALVKKLWEYMLRHFDRIPDRNGLTDGQTDRRTGLLHQSRASVLTRDKNKNGAATQWWKSFRIWLLVWLYQRDARTDRHTTGPRLCIASRGNNEAHTLYRPNSQLFLLSCRSRQQERLSASVLFVCLSVAKMQKRDFLKN